MRAVLDTNVLVSGLLNPAGPCGRLIDLFNESFFQPVYNAGIMAEYESVLLRPEFGFDPEAVDWLLSRVKARGFASNKPFPRREYPIPAMRLS